MEISSGCFFLASKSVLIASRMAVLKTRSYIEKQGGKFNHLKPNIPPCIVNREEKCDLTLSWWQNFWIAKIGNLKVTKTANKQSACVEKTTTLHVHNAFFRVHFLAVVAQLRGDTS